MLQIPHSYKNGFAAILDYSEETLEQLATAVGEATPVAHVGMLSDQLAEATGIESDQLQDVMFALSSLNNVCERRGWTSDELILELREALADDDDERLDPDSSNWEAICRFLGTVLAVDSTLAVTAKASILSSEHERIYCDGKIITDMRVVFDSDRENPAAAMAMHLLRISYHETSQSTENVIFKLDSGDLLGLKTLIDRALKKEDSIRALAKSAGIPFLDGG